MFVFTSKCRLKSYQMLIKHDTVAWSWVGSGLQQHSNCYRQEGLEVKLLCSAIKLFYKGRIRSAAVVLFYQNVL